MYSCHEVLMSLQNARKCLQANACSTKRPTDAAAVPVLIPDTAISALNECDQCLFPNIFVLLKVLATLPVSTCEPERLFSKVEKTLIALRSTMSEDRLEALVLMQTFRDELPDADSVVDKFAAANSRRLQLVI